MTPDNARLFLYEDKDGLHAVRFGANVPLRIPTGATPLGEVVQLRPAERETGWVVQDFKGSMLAESWTDNDDVLVLPSGVSAECVAAALELSHPNSEFFVAKVYRDTLEIAKGGLDGVSE